MIFCPISYSSLSSPPLIPSYLLSPPPFIRSSPLSTCSLPPSLSPLSTAHQPLTHIHLLSEAGRWQPDNPFIWRGFCWRKIFFVFLIAFLFADIVFMFFVSISLIILLIKQSADILLMFLFKSLVILLYWCFIFFSHSLIILLTHQSADTLLIFLSKSFVILLTYPPSDTSLLTL